MKALIFDLDDTLYDEKQFVYGGFLKVAKYLDSKYALDERVLYHQMQDILSSEGRGRIFDSICEKNHINEDIPILIEIYRNAKPHIKLYEDAEYFLKKYKGKYLLGLITDGLYSVQRNKITLLGLEKQMDCIVVTDELGRDCWKPSEKPYIKISEELGVPFSEMAYIGDNPHKDFYSARKLGMLTIRVIRECGEHIAAFLSEEYEADYTINNLYELEDILKKV